jgi:hypothetical protein
MWSAAVTITKMRVITFETMSKWVMEKLEGTYSSKEE